MRLPLGTRIFLGTALVVTAVLGIALLITKRQADRAAESAALQALRATQATIRDALGSRSQTLSQLTAALVQVPVYVSRIGESVRTGNRADLLDQADELRSQTGADWVLITDPSGGAAGLDLGARFVRPGLLPRRLDRPGFGGEDHIGTVGRAE